MRLTRLCCAIILLTTSSQLAAFQIDYLNARRAGPAYRLVMHATLTAPIAAVRAALTDFGHLNRLSKRILDSCFQRSGTAQEFVVYTRVRGCAGMFCRTSDKVERVSLQSPDEIVAEIVPARSDFRSGQSRWSLAEIEGGTVIKYETEIEPRFWIPPILGHAGFLGLMRRDVVESMERIEERAASASAGENAPVNGSDDREIEAGSCEMPAPKE